MCIQFWRNESDTLAGAENLRDSIRSNRSDDPGAADLIDHFTLNLAERVDELQDAETKADLGTLGALSHVLAAKAMELEFDLLAASATDLEGCCLAGDVDAARDALVDLTEISKRIRMTHRGAIRTVESQRPG